MTEGPRLDPGQLPSATRARFSLLLSLATVLAFECGQTFVLQSSPPFTAQAPRFNIIEGGAFCAVALILIASAVYLAHPLKQQNSFGITRKLDQGDPLVVHVDFLCRRLGIETPVLLMDSDIRNYDALAFGLPWRKYLLLGRGLLLLRQTNSKLFDARIAHEVGHIRNGDLGITFFSQGLIVASACLLTATVAHYIAVNLGMYYRSWLSWEAAGHDFTTFLAAQINPITDISLILIVSLAKAFAWAVLLSVEHRSFLRARELYADSTSAIAVGAPAMLVALGRETRTKPATLARVFAAHPDINVRKAALVEPISLVVPTAGGLLLLGYVIGLTLSAVRQLQFDKLMSGAGVDAAKLSNLSYLEFSQLIWSIPQLAAIAIALSLILFPIGIALGSVIFRCGSFISLGNVRAAGAMKRIGLAWVLIALGCFLGFRINPQALDLLWGAQLSIGVAAAGTEILQLLIPAGLVPVGIVVSAPLLYRLFRTPHSAPPAKLVWVGMGISLYILLYLILMGIYFFYLGAPASILAAMGGVAGACFFAAYLLARRTMSPRKSATRTLAPWLFASG